MRSCKLTHRPLFISLQIALALSLPALAHAQYVAPLDVSTDISGRTETSGVANVFVINASGGPSGTTRLIGSDVTAKVLSAGTQGTAVHADTGATIDFTNAQIEAAGRESTAVWARLGGVIKLTDPTILASGVYANGAVANAGILEMNGGSITVSRATGGYGIGAFFAGTVDSTGQTIVSHAEGTPGVFARDPGSAITLHGGSVLVDGFQAWGLVAADSGRISATGTTINAEVEAWAGAFASGGTIELQGAKVIANLPTTEGDALLALGTGSSIIAHDTDVEARGTNTYGVYVGGGASVQLDDNSSIVTEGEHGVGMFATGMDSRLVANSTTITTSGLKAFGVEVAAGAEATLGTGTTVTTSGMLGLGVVASGRDLASGQRSLLTVDGASIKTTGDTAPGAVATDGGLLRFSNARVDASGSASDAVDVFGPDSRLEATSSAFASAQQSGIYMAPGTTASLIDSSVTAPTHALTLEFSSSSPDPQAPIVVEMKGGSLTTDYDAIHVAMANAQISLDNVQVSATNGVLADVNSTGRLALTLTNVDITGDAFAETGSTLDIAMQDASVLHGMVTNGNMMSLVAGSTWNMTDDSDVFSLANAGTIAFAAPTSADFKTLTVRGDYTGNGGTLSLNTVLGGDASQTDKLVVQGNTSGTTNVAINNVGGAGAQTVSGIQVVQVGGASDGTFNLSGRAVAGAYEYSLLKGGVSTPTDGAWYLRSQALPPAVVPPVVEPPVVPVPAAPVTPLYRPEAAAYLANQAAAVGMFRHSMHDRMGEPNFAEKANDDGKAPAAWARVVRSQMDGQAGFDQLDVSTDTSLFQVGGELGRWSSDSRFHFGAMGGTGSADSLADSNLTSYQAKGKVTGYNLGVYGTWFADAAEATGLYVDGWLQYGRYHDRVRGDYLSPERYEAWTLSASVEAGYAFALNDGGNTRFFLEPQAQAIYTDYSSHTHQEYNGTYVNDLDAGGLTTRLGLRFYGHSSVTGGNRVQPFATLNWWHDDNANVMSFNDAVLKLFLPRNQYELKLGAQAQLGGGWTGWGNLGLVSGDEDYRDVNGQVGVNYRW